MARVSAVESQGSKTPKKEAVLRVCWVACCAAWWYLESQTEVLPNASKPPWPPIPDELTISHLCGGSTV